MIKKPNKKCYVSPPVFNKGIGIYYYHHALNFIGAIYISKKIEMGPMMSNNIKNGLIKPFILSQYD